MCENDKGTQRNYKVWHNFVNQINQKLRDIQIDHYKIRNNRHGIVNIFRIVCDMFGIIVANCWYYCFAVQNQPCISIFFQIWSLLRPVYYDIRHLHTGDALPTVRCKKCTVSTETQ